MLKRSLVRMGSWMPARAVHGIRVATGYVAIGNWVERRGFGAAPRVDSRNAVFDVLLAEFAGDPIAYLEFGVFQGASLRYWSTRLTHPNAELHGFDSFRGLPATFDDANPIGMFDLGGQPPTFDDPRVTIHVGWFESTLPEFVVPEGKRLVVALDADIYSATKFVLDALDGWITQGTVVYFDDLSRIDHEPAAFDDYMHSTGKRFEAIAFEHNLNTGAFICSGPRVVAA